MIVLWRPLLHHQESPWSGNPALTWAMPTPHPTPPTPHYWSAAHHWGHLVLVGKDPLSRCVHGTQRPPQTLSCPFGTSKSFQYSPVFALKPGSEGSRPSLQLLEHRWLFTWFAISPNLEPQGMSPGSFVPAPSPDLRPPWGGEVGHTDNSLQRNPPYLP